MRTVAEITADIERVTAKLVDHPLTPKMEELTEQIMFADRFHKKYVREKRPKLAEEQASKIEVLKAEREKLRRERDAERDELKAERKASRERVRANGFQLWRTDLVFDAEPNLPVLKDEEVLAAVKRCLELEAALRDTRRMLLGILEEREAGRNVAKLLKGMSPAEREALGRAQAIAPGAVSTDSSVKSPG